MSIPDPQDVATYESSRLDWAERDREPHASTLRFYRAWLALRRNEPALRANSHEDNQAVALDQDTLLLRREGSSGDRLLIVARLRGSGAVELARGPGVELPEGGRWEVVLTSEDPAFAPDPMPPHVDLTRRAPTIDFARPSTVVLRASFPGDGRDGSR